MNFKRSDFPEDFLFGAATAAYQVEGHAYGGAGPCHWDTFAATPGNVVNAEDGAVACDHYHRYQEDLDLLKAAGLDAYRFSTSWARVLPEGRGTPNAEGLDFYERLVDALLERGIKPVHTLYHWEMPSALADLGGWANPDVHEWFADYAEVISGRIGDRVHLTATLNEPWCMTFLSHFVGHHAPGLRDIRATARSMHFATKAHAAAVSRLREMGRDNLGIVLNFDHTRPVDDSPEAARAADLQDGIFNRWFIEAITRGTYPEVVLDGLAPHMPKGWEADMEQIAQPIDWLGVNYYTRHFAAPDPGAPWPAIRQEEGDRPRTQMGWEIFPEGLEDFLVRMKKDYVGDLPLYVTENGMARADEITGENVEDPERIDFIDGHVQATKRALDRGANVKGFFYWSLLDNYEWAFGYEKRFGLVHVDFDSLKRRPKASYHALAAALKE